MIKYHIAHSQNNRLNGAGIARASGVDGYDLVFELDTARLGGEQGFGGDGNGGLMPVAGRSGLGIFAAFDDVASDGAAGTGFGGFPVELDGIALLFGAYEGARVSRDGLRGGRGFGGPSDVVELGGIVFGVHFGLAELARHEGFEGFFGGVLGFGGEFRGGAGVVIGVGGGDEGVAGGGEAGQVRIGKGGGVGGVAFDHLGGEQELVAFVSWK